MKSASTAAKRVRRETLSLRIPAAERNLIDRAVLLNDKTRTDFILTAARRAAEEAPLDRAPLMVEPARYTEFLSRLEAKPKPNARLRRTLKATPPW